MIPPLIILAAAFACIVLAGPFIPLVNHFKYKKLLKDNEVLVVPGFIGSTNENEVITLGRGTSDLTTVELAKLFKENEVILYKEVDGIYPTIFINLNLIKPYDYLSYQEVESLLDIGISPINKKALKEAKESNIVIVIKNFNINNNQTIISNKNSEKLLMSLS